MTASATPLLPVSNPFLAHASATFKRAISSPYRDFSRSSCDRRYCAAASKWSCLTVICAIQFYHQFIMPSFRAKGRKEEMSLQEGRIRQKGNLYYSLLPVLIYNKQILSLIISQLIHSCMIPLTFQLNRCKQEDGSRRTACCQ